MRMLVGTAVLTVGLATLPVTAAQAGSTWLVGIKAGDTTAVAGHRVVFTGKVHPTAAASGLQVVLQEQAKPGKPWVTQRKAKVSPAGAYRVTDTPTISFLHSYRVIMPASGTHTRGVSPTVKVRVYAWDHLTDHASVNNRYMNIGEVNVNGTAYADSVWARYAEQTSVEYNLNHQCVKLRSTFGVSDASSTGGQAEVDVQSDGAPVYTNTFDLGETETRTVALDKPLKIRLAAQNTATAPDAYGYGAFADPQVLCTH